MKNFNNTFQEINKRKVIQKEDLKNLDEFIQKCLDKFRFVEPKRELYEATGNDKDLIISHKSTIPDLVIWNKTFNKNICFIGANTLIHNEFPRYLFYIKIKKNKKSKYLNNNIKNKYPKDTDFNFVIFEDKNPVKNNENNNIYENFNIIKDNENSNFNFNQNNKVNNNNNYKNNKFSLPIRTIMSSCINIFDINKLTIYLIQMYLYKNGWIILNRDCFSGPGTSINLFQFLQEKIKENINLNEFIIIDINKKVKYFGNHFYIILSNILPTIIQKNKMELISYEEIMNKENYYILSNTNNYYNNVIVNTINNFNNNINNKINNINISEIKDDIFKNK